MWPSALSGRLCIVALVGRYLTNQLMHRRSIHVHGQGHFNSSQMLVCYLSGFSIRFQKLSRAHGQVTYVLLTRSPLDSGKQAFLPLVRLACIRHAASVHPEPGSNSPFDWLFMFEPLARVLYFFRELLQISLTFPVQFSKIELLLRRRLFRLVPVYNTKSSSLLSILFLPFFSFFLINFKTSWFYRFLNGLKLLI